MPDPSNAQKDYEKVFDLSREAKTLEGISMVLEWDAETYMPDGACAIRAQQRELLAGIIHEKRTSKDFHHALEKLIDLKTGAVIAEGLTERQRAALREWQRDYRIATALPTAFVQEFTKLTSDAQIVWRDARANNAFYLFEPWLQRIVDSLRQKADLLGYSENPYDALLDLYEPYARSTEVSTLFGSLRTSIRSLLDRITQAPQIDNSLFKGNFPEIAQMEFAKKLLEAVGFDRAYGRLDVSTHPFSNAFHPTDSRLTTRIDVSDPVSSLLSTLHEFGHGLYEQNLPANEYGSPLGEAASHGIHESQSRFWETRIGLSKPFCHFVLPLLQKFFPEAFTKATPAALFKAINRVEPSYIRTEADEVTYTLHIILRFELEMDLINGTLKVKDLPEAWNAKMKELLGVTPPSDTKGCLQDIHWAHGSFGYFPTYALGNVYSAHLFESFENSFPSWQESVKQGDFTCIRNWLRDQVHHQGRTYAPLTLLKKITGKKVTSDAYVGYLENKYSDVYSLT